MATTDVDVGSLPLESGDRLTRAEFHRRYGAHPEIRKAELIEGVVYVASPVRQGVHGQQSSEVITWLGVYKSRTAGVNVGDSSTVYLDADNEVQPDACIYWDPPRGSGARLTEDGYLEGPPQLVVEVAASSASYDLHDKLQAYRRAGVLEYIVWQVLIRKLSWFRLHEGRYLPVEPDAEGIIESSIFPGLRLAVPALLAGDLAGVLAAL